MTAGGAAGFSAGGAAGAAGLCTGGDTTTVFSGGTTAGGGGALGAMTAAGFSTAGGAAGAAGFMGTLGATAGGAAAAITGRVGTTGRWSCSSLSLSWRATSPGLWTLEKSILGLISAGADFSREGAEPDLAAKCLLISSASWSSIEEEWVFISFTHTSGKASMISLLFTSSSLARSLIRIFTLCVSSGFTLKRSYSPHALIVESAKNHDSCSF